MGWTDEINEFKMCDLKTLEEGILMLHNFEKEEYGTDYGMYWAGKSNVQVSIVSDIVFETKDDAQKYLFDHLNKYEKLVAVKFVDKTISQKELDLIDEIDKLKTKLSSYIVFVSKNIVNNSKKSYNGSQCPCCKNRWCSDFVKKNKCELCDLIYFNEEEKLIQNNLQNTIKQLEEDLKIEKEKPVDVGALKWLVGGWTPA